MVNKVVLSDLERFNELGRLVNDNFVNLFNLSSLLASNTDSIYGYYEDNVQVTRPMRSMPFRCSSAVVIR